MRRRVALLVVAALGVFASGGAAPPPPSSPSILPSPQWRDLAARNPRAVESAIASARRRGWKPTADSQRISRGVPASLRPVSMMQEWVGNGSGEMLIWDWDDGDPSNVEGTVYIHSYATGNEATFNIQLAGEAYGDVYAQWSETTYTSYNEPVMAATFLAARRPRLLRAQQRDRSGCQQCYDQEIRYHQNRCNFRYLDAGSDCLAGNVRQATVEGLRGAVIGAGIGAATGWRAGRLRGALIGAAVGAAEGFGSNVLQYAVFGLDLGCRERASAEYTRCMNEPIDFHYCDFLFCH